MFNKYSILVALVMAVAVSANVIPKDVEERVRFPTVYDGNNLIIGERTEDDYQLTQYGVWGYPVENEVVTKTLDINSLYEITSIVAYDKSEDEESGAFPVLISGEVGGKTASLLFISKPGGRIYYWVDVFGRRS